MWKKKWRDLFRRVEKFSMNEAKEMNYLDNPDQFLADVNQSKLVLFEEMKTQINKYLQKAAEYGNDYVQIDYEKESQFAEFIKMFNEKYSDKWIITVEEKTDPYKNPKLTIRVKT